MDLMPGVEKGPALTAGTVHQVPPDQPLPERRFIEDAPRNEIVSLFKVFADKAKAADDAREAFVSFINVVREQMGIPKNEFWDIAEDATYFEKRVLPEASNGVVALPDGRVPIEQGDDIIIPPPPGSPVPPTGEYAVAPPPPPTANALTGESVTINPITEGESADPRV
jgi:hypothetical protein